MTPTFSFSKRTFPSAIANVAIAEGVDISSLKSAFQFTETKLASISQGLFDDIHELDVKGVDVIVCGSGGRGELNEGSDFDYLILVDRPPAPRVLQRISQVMNGIIDTDESLSPPGKSGIFADITISAELQARVGLGGDTSNNLTRRLLLLTESRSILDESVRSTSIKGVLQRYCDDYHPDALEGPSKSKIPRFLLNDVVRYWRTIAVDFAAKRWNDPDDDKAYTRRVKLLHSRKLLFAGSLASLFRIARSLDSGVPAYDELVALLVEDANRTPLERLALLWQDGTGTERAAIGQVLKGYCSFMTILGSAEKRAILKLPVSQSEVQELRASLDASGKEIQIGLKAVFFGETLRELTEEYAIF